MFDLIELTEFSIPPAQTSKIWRPLQTNLYPYKTTSYIGMQKKTIPSREVFFLTLFGHIFGHKIEW